MRPQVLSRRDQVWPATMRALAVHDSEPGALIHSDVHIGNWCRTGADQMGLCDWQCLSPGHWSRDFAYAVTASLTAEDRRNWERDLLALYIGRFAEHTGAKPDFRSQFPALPAADSACARNVDDHVASLAAAASHAAGGYYARDDRTHHDRHGRPRFDRQLLEIAVSPRPAASRGPDLTLLRPRNGCCRNQLLTEPFRPVIG